MPKPKNTELPRMLLEAARAMLVEDGQPSFSLRRLSADVGYTLTAIYRCYADRAALLRALQLHLFSELNSYVVPPPGLTAYEAVLHSGRAFAQWAMDHPAEYLFMFNSYDPAVLLSAADARTAQAGLHMFAELLRLADRNKEVVVNDAQVVAVQLIASLHGLVSLSLTGRLANTPADDLSAYFDTHVEAQLRALLPRKA